MPENKENNEAEPSISALMNEVAQKRAAGEFKAALESCRGALLQNGSDFEANFAYAELLLEGHGKMGFASALIHARNTVVLQPENPAAMALLERACAAVGKPIEEAATWRGEVLRLRAEEAKKDEVKPQAIPA